MVSVFLPTVFFAITSAVLTFALGLTPATISQWPYLPFKTAYRILLILPYAMPGFSFLVVRGLFKQNFGSINPILESAFRHPPQLGSEPNSRVTYGASKSLIHCRKRAVNMARFDLSDEEWAVILPLLPKKGRGPTRKDDRTVLNGIFFILRTGVPWRDLPERYGPYTAV